MCRRLTGEILGTPLWPAVRVTREKMLLGDNTKTTTSIASAVSARRKTKKKCRAEKKKKKPFICFEPAKS